MATLDVSADLGYGSTVIAAGMELTLPAGGFTVIIGPNACGKSTLLRSLARLLHPLQGAVLLDGQDISTRKTKEVAKEIGLLPQQALAPEGITVAELVARGRSPHQGLFRQFSPEDASAVAEAMAMANISDLAERPVDALSGGQRQRVWLALTLAQQTPTVLLDEPTTFLDMAHQTELLELCRYLYLSQGRTIIAVLHDLNQAARYATRIIAMKQGQIVADGEPAQVVTPELVQQVFGVESTVIEDPVTGGPLVVPHELTYTPSVVKH